MIRLINVNRKMVVIAFACCVVFLLTAAALAFNTRTDVLQPQNSSRRDDKEALKLQVMESPDQSLRIVGNDDCPFKIVAAKVKEVPGNLFTKLTGRTTDLVTISSTPNVTLLNTSGQEITKFILIVRDPKLRKTRGVIKHDVSIRPGETYIINRELFVTPDKITEENATGQAHQTLVNPGIKSEKGWLEFAARPDLFVTVGLIDFKDGSSWKIKEGGEAR